MPGKKHFIIYAYTTMIFMFSTAFAEDGINIAAIYALSGPAAETNAIAVQGIRHGVNEINGQGGLLGKKINLLVIDNLSTPLGSNAAAARAVEAGAVAIIGPSWSSHAIAAAKMAQAEKVPMISESATSPKKGVKK